MAFPPQIRCRPVILATIIHKKVSLTIFCPVCIYVTSINYLGKLHCMPFLVYRLLPMYTQRPNEEGGGTRNYDYYVMSEY